MSNRVLEALQLLHMVSKSKYDINTWSVWLNYVLHMLNITLPFPGFLIPHLSVSSCVFRLSIARTNMEKACSQVSYLQNFIESNSYLFEFVI